MLLRLPPLSLLVSLGLALCLATTACKEKEILNPIPQTSLQGSLLFNTPDRVLGQVNGLYAGLKNGSYYGGRYLMLSDIRGEEFINRLQNVFTGYDAWNHTINSGSNDALTTWSTAYAAINSANLVIDGLAANPNVVPAATATQYTGEAKLVRALSYFALVTLYGQPYLKDAGASLAVPLRLSGETTTANNDMARSKVAAVYTQILKDLNEAEASLPLTYATALLNTTRAHRNTAIALKTRVYLSMGRYADVVTEAQKIVSATAPYKASTGVGHALQASISTIFNSDYTTTESILSMPMTTLDNVSGQNSLGYEYNINQEYNLSATGILGNATWRAADARRSLLRVSGTTYYLVKYRTANPYLDYVPVIRYAEVLLNYAEALARQATPDLATATAVLTAVRQRSDATYTFPAATVGTASALTSTIWVERRIELLGEGFRSNDLLRNLLTIPAKGTAPSITPSQPEYIFPIPNAEISSNKLL
ncbi:RagB/SusD family nutrient uptake outer membrane protein [Hymenobacter sp. UV11]|uniref:RagB/SusD family nutrient uptake outer membrane protein n=1 Tax=Hymenobacter sp. UV11 TaxID=1849735 RepID=UPI001061B0F7|nr:RagB/SusD family nutrient uptake outer membrane protein [Hymenobacter sp. UV11]TDN38516.1 carbohydrate-binding protein SusD [Hymenobacter sp. UV11]TFZ65284.1 RagB/SusD family nutrient uptake outer membrane protein [Hymenobacter sp. UV11]